MHLTKLTAFVFIGLSGTCFASTDPACLKHLGGAFGDVECFNGLSNDLRQENRRLAKEVSTSIPNQNKNKVLLTAYLRSQVDSERFCELARQSLTGWAREPATVNPRYHDYDVAYYECVYTLLDQQNKFLKNVLKNAREN